MKKRTHWIGGMLMYDYAMDGIMKSVYASANMSYNIVLADGPVVHRLGRWLWRYLWKKDR